MLQMYLHGAKRRAECGSQDSAPEISQEKTKLGAKERFKYGENPSHGRVGLSAKT